jgi:ubiquinone/menaquinone biosynthesis C-methylase UbiE
MSSQTPGNSNLFDSYSERYDEAVNDAIAFSKLKVELFVRVKAAYMQDILASHFSDPSSIELLDVGCGIGSYHPYWIDSVGSLRGVDLSLKCIERASKRNPRVGYETYDGDRLPFVDHSFDAVVTICVMHHIDPPKRPRFAAELRRVTKPGGITVVFEHNPSNFLTRRVVSSCIFDKGVSLLPHQETENLMRQACFDVGRSRFILLVPAFTKLLRRVDSLFSWLPLGAQYFTCGIAQAAN